MRMIARRVAVGLVLLLLAISAGCQSTAGGARKFSGEFQTLALAEGPARLQSYYEQSGSLPGLAVFQQDGRTYLLLTAGRTERPGLVIDVLAVQPPVKGSKAVQVLAAMRSGTGDEGVYPYALIEVDGGAGLTFSARLSKLDETPLELQGFPLIDR